MVAVTPTAAANALLRPAIHEFELAMDPLVKAWAKTKWGEVQEVGWKRPKWAHICYNCVGKDMRPFFDPAKLRPVGPEARSGPADALWEGVERKLGYFAAPPETSTAGPLAYTKLQALALLVC